VVYCALRRRRRVLRLRTALCGELVVRFSFIKPIIQSWGLFARRIFLPWRTQRKNQKLKIKMTNKNSKIEGKSGFFKVFFEGDVGF